MSKISVDIHEIIEAILVYLDFIHKNKFGITTVSTVNGFSILAYVFRL